MKRLSRRGFLRSSAAAIAGSGAAPALAGKPPDVVPGRARVRRYKPFGKTGWMVGDISAGSGQREPGMIEHLFASGINVIDTGAQYGNHEEVLGQVLPRWRDKVFVVSKWDPPLVSANATKGELLQAIDVSLARLRTTYIDCFMIHSIGQPRYGGLERIQNPAIYEAWDEAKKLGKIRFSGASSHGVNMIEEMSWGVDNGRFDVILLGANFLTRGLEPLLEKARARGVATIAMKTMTIYKADLGIRELQDQETSARQAVLKWVLASDLFDTLVIGMRNLDQVREYLAVSGTTSLSARDRGYLDTVAAAVSGRYCRPGCAGCHGSCPAGVPIADVLRYKMYFEHYGEEKLAMQSYQRIEAARRAAGCATCTAPCEEACPHGLRIRQRLAEAHGQLSLA